MAFDPVSLLALGGDHVRMLAVWHIVPPASEQVVCGEAWRGVEPSLWQWAQLADVPVVRVREIWPVLRDLGMVLPDRTVPKEVRGVLARRVREMIEG
jgi:hypothetical protein